MVCAGWLLGSYPKAFNDKDFTEALRLHPLLIGKDVAAKVQKCKLQFKAKVDLKYRAVHIFCAEPDLPSIRKSFNRIYGSEKAGGLPQGKDMKFVPYTADLKRPPSPALLRKVMQALRAQREFTENCEHMENPNVENLDYRVDHGINASLRQVVMCMKASDGLTNMFVSVDVHWNGNAVFVYHKELRAEAEAAISQLHFILEAKFGPRAWQWFSPTLQAQSSGLHWDPKTGEVNSNEEEALTEALKDFGFEYLDEDEEEFFGLSGAHAVVPMDLDLQINLDALPDSTPAYDINGSIGTLRHHISEIDTDTDDATNTASTPATDLSSLTPDSRASPQNDLARGSATAMEGVSKSE